MEGYRRPADGDHHNRSESQRARRALCICQARRHQDLGACRQAESPVIGDVHGRKDRPPNGGHNAPLALEKKAKAKI